MTDRRDHHDHLDRGPDPLAGRDPHPREQIDLWPLHDARQELLEEIVSQPGPGKTAAPSARRFMVPVGIAAAIALVAGGAWFVVAGDDADKSDDQVAASTDSPTDDPDDTDGSDSATDPTDPTTATEPSEPENPPVSQLEKGDVLSPEQCRKLRDGRFRPGATLTIDGLETRLDQLSYVLRLRSKDGRLKGVQVVQASRTRFLAIDKDCTVVAVDRVRVEAPGR